MMGCVKVTASKSRFRVSCHPGLPIKIERLRLLSGITSGGAVSLSIYPLFPESYRKLRVSPENYRIIPAAGGMVVSVSGTFTEGLSLYVLRFTWVDHLARESVTWEAVSTRR